MELPIGALALINKHWDAVLDERALAHEAILVSAGQRGVNLRVPVADLVRVLGAQTAAIARTEA